RRDPRAILQRLSKTGSEPAVGPLGCVVIPKDAPLPEPQVVEQILDQSKARDRILLLPLEVLNQANGPAEHLVDVDRRDPEISVRRRGHRGHDRSSDGVLLLKMAQGIRVHQVHGSAPSFGSTSRRRSFMISMYCWNKASSWNAGTVRRQGSATAPSLSRGT